MTKIYSTLGRKFNKKDLEEAMRMGEEMVNYFFKVDCWRIFLRVKDGLYFNMFVLAYEKVTNLKGTVK